MNLNIEFKTIINNSGYFFIELIVPKKELANKPIVKKQLEYEFHIPKKRGDNLVYVVASKELKNLDSLEELKENILNKVREILKELLKEQMKYNQAVKETIKSEIIQVEED